MERQGVQQFHLRLLLRFDNVTAVYLLNPWPSLGAGVGGA